jgi:two-component system NtrC family response regulator
MEKPKILIAEDEKTQRDLLEGFLKKEGFSVETVADGREFLKKLQGDFFDTALIDYKMPQLDGLQTLREIRKLYPELPVIMMTAYGTVETAVASMKEGALDYITKPIDLDELLLMLQKVVERSNLIKENKELKAQLQERYEFTNIVYGSPKMEEGHGPGGSSCTQSNHILIRGRGNWKELIAT